MKENFLKSKLNPKRKRILLWFLATITFLCLVAIVLISKYLDSVVKDQIEKSVHQSSQGLYSLKIEKLYSHFWTGAIEVENILLHQDTSVLKRFQQQMPKEKFSNVHIFINSAKIHHIRWINYLINKDLKVGKIILESPEMVVIGSSPSESIRSSNKNFIDLLPGIIAGFAGSLKIEELIIQEGNLSYDINGDKGIISQRAGKIFIDLKDILIDTIPTKKVLYSEDIIFNLKSYSLKTPDLAYSINIGEVSGALSDSSLQINKLHFVQNDTLNYNQILTEVFIENIEGKGVSFRDFFYSKQIAINKITIESPKVKALTKIPREATKGGSHAIGKKILIPTYVSNIVRSFNINMISVRDGEIKSEIIVSESSINQSADKIFIDILEVSGKTVDSVNLNNPNHIIVSFKNYHLNLQEPNLTLTLNSFKASSLNSSLHIDGIALKYAGGQNTQEISVHTNAKHFFVKGFNIHSILEDQKIDFEQVVLNSPHINVNSSGAISKNKTSKSPPNSLPAFITDFVDSLRIDLFAIENGSFIYKTIDSANLVIHQMEKVNLAVNNVYSKRKNEFYFDKITSNLKNYELKIGKERFSLKIASASISSLMSEAILNDIIMIQDHPPGIEANHYTCSIKDISFRDFDVERALYKFEISAGAVNIDNMSFKFLLHEGKAIRPEYAQIMPNEIVKKLNFYFNIRQVNLNKAFISYSDDTGNKPLLFTFEKTHGKIINLTNNPEFMTLKRPCILTAETWILGQGRLNFTVSIPLLSKDLVCNYKGTFDGMDVKGFNNVLSFAGVKVERGAIEPSSFDVNVSDGTAQGQMELIYHDLHVKLLNKEGKTSKFKSIMGNFVIKNNNPNNKSEKPETVEVAGKRKSEDSFFSFLSRPLQEGIIKVVTKDSVYPK